MKLQKERGYCYLIYIQKEDTTLLLSGERINNIRYADDTVIFADNVAGLQLIDKITDSSQKIGLDINTKKTKLMVINTEKINVTNWQSKTNRTSEYLHLFGT